MATLTISETRESNAALAALRFKGAMETFCGISAVAIWPRQHGNRLRLRLSVSRRGGRDKGGRKQMRANANKRRQALTNAEAKTQANASKREQTLTNANKRLHPPLLRFFAPPLCNPQCSFFYPYPSVSVLARGNSDHGPRKTRTKTQTTPDSVFIGETRNSDHGLSFWGGKTQTMVRVSGVLGVGVDEGALQSP